ncbi:hypothetical protein WICMUC_000469 [Wickerhamomyces mucosus]|uniref:Major facilitator superfamily (MFS) profile domain-containing protein n=1 Tax=Wickerhamomyces mucosus TaxID=1378264 RepID=A0A9P8PZQ4_9ASCO|nr:hypothetical protein WICMUC_000469 [Wickerhamomyces mucosus]
MSRLETGDERKARIQHLENVAYSSDEKKGGGLNTNPHDDELWEAAKIGTEDEHNLTIGEAIKYHKASILWSMVFSATIIMEGYDNSLMTSFFAYPAFAKKYGYLTDIGDYQLSGSWQVALGTGSSVGSFIGVVANGYLTERWGHRNVILVSLVFMAGFIFIPFFAPNVNALVAGQVLCGLPWGVFATMGPSYASEVVPLRLRGYLAAYTNICWATGQFISAGVLQGLESYGADDPYGKGQWAYRIPFAVQWVWVIPLFVLTFLAPDSPQWLIRKDRIDDAHKSLERLTSSKIHHKVPHRLAMLRHTNNLERQTQNQVGEEVTGLKSFLKCFQGTNLRRTEIGCISFSGQVLSGSTFAYSPSYFFSQAGLSSTETYKLNLGTTAIAWLGTALSWLLFARYGRRTIYLTGYTILTFLLLLIGILACPTQTSGIKWAQAGITMVWVATYALTIGPGAFIFSVEASSTRLRPQSVALARGSYTLCSLISNVVEPYLINPGNANLKGKTAFVWFATAFLTWIWSIFRLPETKDRTYEELDILFEKRVPARKFSSYQIDLDEQVPEVVEDSVQKSINLA